MSQGLYDKYNVERTDGEPVGDCFVLEPEDDPAAFEALKIYAWVTDNPELRADLYEWLAEIDP